MAAIQRGYSARFVIWSDLISKRIDHDETDTMHNLEALKNVDFLAIDKVNGDTIKDPKFPAETLDLILNYRYSNQKPTLIILDTSLDDARRRLPVLGELACPMNVSEVEGINYRINTIR